MESLTWSLASLAAVTKATDCRRSIIRVYAALMKDRSSPTIVPRIETARLTLRGLRRDDFGPYAASMADPEAMKYMSGVCDRRAAWRVFTSVNGLWMLDGAGWWAVELRETEEMVGTVGAFYRETSPELEIGWTIYPRFWRRGFATEAAQAALAFAVTAHSPKRVIAHISEANSASVRVSKNIGMHYESDVEFYGDIVGRYEIET